MTGIICAMQLEMDGLRAQMTDTVSETVSGIEFVRGTLCGAPVVTAVCGVGKVFAALCAQTMILRYAPARLINTGVAGSLSPALTIGNIAIARDVVQHDMDTSPLGDPVGLLSGINIVHIPADPALGEALEASAAACGLTVRRGTIATGDQFISSGEQKSRIRDSFDAIACEMEGGAIGHVCYVNGTPFAVLRAISDGGDEEASMDYPTFARMAAENSVRVLTDYLAR
ncbi:MAG: 5'-methylthioadenosine/adenosylhomocysteine nucleosidase [Clostridia bacterium]|nr:5'-methylthioadenosine/adenosylhomocysteine nucleosidase [Clostridia bacterium]